LQYSFERAFFVEHSSAPTGTGCGAASQGADLLAFFGPLRTQQMAAFEILSLPTPWVF
jgi:hypothetical protein